MEWISNQPLENFEAGVCFVGWGTWRDACRIICQPLRPSRSTIGELWSWSFLSSRASLGQYHANKSRSLLIFFRAYLRGDVGVLLPVSITVVCVDVVRPDHAVHRLQHHPGVVVSYHIRVPVLRLVHLFLKREEKKLKKKRKSAKSQSVY